MLMLINKIYKTHTERLWLPPGLVRASLPNRYDGGPGSALACRRNGHLHQSRQLAQIRNGDVSSR